MTTDNSAEREGDKVEPDRDIDDLSECFVDRQRELVRIIGRRGKLRLAAARQIERNHAPARGESVDVPDPVRPGTAAAVLEQNGLHSPPNTHTLEPPVAIP